MARPDLNNPRTAVVVLGLLAVVAGFNLKTYVLDGDGGGRPFGRAERSRPDPRPPADLADVVERALGGSDLIAVAVERGGTTARSVRDPFRRDAPAAATAAAADTSGARPVDPLACTAVIVDGAAPSAVVGGQRRRIGDRVAGWTVAAIDARGVLVTDGRGRERRLPVRPGDDDSDYLITFDARHDTPLQQPDVADGPENERRER